MILERDLMVIRRSRPNSQKVRARGGQPPMDVLLLVDKRIGLGSPSFLL